jgi:hypothetical protein
VCDNRFLSANEQHGNYILTGLLAFNFSAPTGSRAFTTNNFAITPASAAGKGWGDFDVQLTFGDTLPTGDFHKLGTPLLTGRRLTSLEQKRKFPSRGAWHFASAPLSGKLNEAGDFQRRRRMQSSIGFQPVSCSD